jgi:hypothetical protein
MFEAEMIHLGMEGRMGLASHVPKLNIDVASTFGRNLVCGILSSCNFL